MTEGPRGRVALTALSALALLALVILWPTAVDARILVGADGEDDGQSPVWERMDPDEIARWIDTEVLPIPNGPPEPLSALRARGGSGWAQFRDPFPRVPVWDPPGVKRVGLQAGHWEYAEAPDELSDLRSNPGAYGGGMAEWEVNLEIAQRTAAVLREAGVEVDVLPTTIPVRYRANLFVSIHADGDPGGTLTGYKVGRPLFSSIPEVDDGLVDALNGEYGATTGLERHDEQVTRRMTGYYAFNARRYQHAVAPGVPQAIIETGFLTNAADRRLLVGNPDLPALGIARGILSFLQEEP